MLTNQKRNVAADRRANSLKLKPLPPQSNPNCQITCMPKLTDIEHVRRDRLQQFEANKQ